MADETEQGAEQEQTEQAEAPGPNEVPEDSGHEPFEDEDGKPYPGTPEADVPKGTEEPGYPQPGQPSADEADEAADAGDSDNTGDNTE